MATTPAPEEVIELVERFERNRDSYLAGGINEMQLRREFLRLISRTPYQETAKDLTLDAISV